MDYPTIGNPDHSEPSTKKDTSESAIAPESKGVIIMNIDLWSRSQYESGTYIHWIEFRMDTIYTIWTLLVFIIAVETFLFWRTPSTTPCPIAAWEDVAPIQGRFSVGPNGSKDSDRTIPRMFLSKFRLAGKVDGMSKK